MTGSLYKTQLDKEIGKKEKKIFKLGLRRGRPKRGQEKPKE